MADDPRLDQLSADAEKVEQARSVYEKIRRRRDREIVAMTIDGYTSDQLAAAAGLSAQRVSQILTKSGYHRRGPARSDAAA